MAEFLKPFDDVTKRINRIKYFLLEDDEPSEDTDFLLAPGKIEELVREGRAPILRGQIGVPGEELQPLPGSPLRS